QLHDSPHFARRGRNRTAGHRVHQALAESQATRLLAQPRRPETGPPPPPEAILKRGSSSSGPAGGYSSTRCFTTARHTASVATRAASTVSNRPTVVIGDRPGGSSRRPTARRLEHDGAPRLAAARGGPGVGAGRLPKE